MMVFTNIQLFVTAIKAFVAFGTRHYRNKMFVSVVMNSAEDEELLHQFSVHSYMDGKVIYEYKEYFVTRS